MATDPFRIPPSMRLQNLENEPQRLVMEADRLNNELDSLVMDNYRVFIENLTCSAYLRSEDKILKSASREVRVQLQSLMQQCTSFRERAQQLVTTHQRNRKTLQHHMQLIELLEIPQLVEACARNGFYDESIDIAAHVTHLHSLSSRGGRIMKTIVNDILVCMNDLRVNLLQKLAAETSLPKLLTVVSALRRIDGLLLGAAHAPEQMQREIARHEVILMMNYLEARSVGVKKGYSSGRTGNAAYGRCVEMIETCRSSWQTAISQYSAIFSDSHASALLSCWLRNHINGFLSALRSEVEALEDGAALRSVFEQSFAFAARIGAVGGDFSAEIARLFNDVLLSRLRTLWQEGAQNTCTLLVRDSLASGTSQAVTLPLFLPQDQSSGDSLLLLNYPPLAYLFNTLVVGCNLLKEVPLRCLMEDVYHILGDTLCSVCRGVTSQASVIDSRGQIYVSSESNTRIMRQHLSSSPLASMSSVLAGILVEYVAPQAEEMLSSIFSSEFSTLQCICSDIFLEAGLLQAPALSDRPPAEDITLSTTPQNSTSCDSGEDAENVTTSVPGNSMSEEPALTRSTPPRYTTSCDSGENAENVTISVPENSVGEEPADAGSSASGDSAIADVVEVLDENA